MSELSDWCRANPHLASMEIEQHKARIEALEAEVKKWHSAYVAARDLARTALAPETEK